MRKTKAGETDRRPGWSLALLAFGSLITSLDFTIIFVALPEIAEVGFSAHSLQWVVSAYVILWGGFLLLGGRSADLLGRRRMFVVGMLLYGGASLLGGFASTPATLVAARALQGLGAAVLFPAVLSLVNGMFPEGPARNRALAVWAGAGAAGLGLGALLGGILTEELGWEAVFLVNVPLVAVASVAAFPLLPADGPRRRGHRFDVPGALTGTAGVTLLVLAIAQGPEIGWGSWMTLAAGALAAMLLTAFATIEARSPSPLMPLRLFANRSLSAGMAVIFIFGGSWQAIPYFLTLYLQSVLGFSALDGGLAFFSLTAAIAFGNFLAERLVARAGTRVTLITGFAVATAGAGLLGSEMVVDGSYLAVLPGILVAGLGGGLIYPAMFMAASTGVAPDEHGIASGMASTALQLGTATGLAVLVGVATAELDGLTGEPLLAATADGLATAVYGAAGGVLAGVLAAFWLPRRRAAAVSEPRAADVAPRRSA